MANVTFTEDALKDWRFAALARAYKMPRAWGRGVMLGVWSICTEQCTYVLPSAAVDAIGYDDGGVEGLADALVAAQLAETMDGGLLRIKGTEGRVEWLAGCRKSGQRGGLASAAKRAEEKKTKETKDSLKRPSSDPQATLELPSSGPSSAIQPPDPDPEKKEQVLLLPASRSKRSRPAPEGGSSLPWTIAEFMATLAKAAGRNVDPRACPSGIYATLTAVLKAAVADGLTLPQVATIGAYIATWKLETPLTAAWFATSGKLESAWMRAQAWSESGARARPDDDDMPPVAPRVVDEPDPVFYRGPTEPTHRCLACRVLCPVSRRFCDKCTAAGVTLESLGLDRPKVTG